MTVKRTGKKGTHARLRRTSRNGRVRTNAYLKAATKNVDERATRNRTSREEWVVHLVTRVLGSNASYVEGDDVASDIIFELLNNGGFSWDEEEIEIFCRKKMKGMILRMAGKPKEVRECDIALGGDFAEGSSIIERLLGATHANQENVVDAKIWAARLRSIPDQQRLALEILCDGGNPIDVAKEMEIDPWAAITLIKEGRRYIHMVDGGDEIG